MVANIFPADPPPNPRGDRSKFYFFRTWSCCISNLKKESQMQQQVGNILPADPPPPPRQHWGSKCQNLCQEVQYTRAEQKVRRIC